MPKAKKQANNGRESLSEVYSPSVPKQKTPKKGKTSHGNDNEQQNFIDAKFSTRILKFGRQLADEDQSEQEKLQPNKAFNFDSRFQEPASDELEEPIEDDDAASWEDEDEDDIGDDVDPKDQDIFNRFHPPQTDPSWDPNNLSFDTDQPGRNENPSTNEGTNLADLILEKIAAHEAATAGGDTQETPKGRAADEDTLDDIEEDIELPPKVIEAYTTIGQLLSRQRSGPLPKPFKILPTLPFSQVPVLISLTRPEDWTPHVILESTRLFISSKPGVAQPFLTNILLPRVRTDIHETKKLHQNIYRALKKSLYKPACFFKGLLFPLLEGHDGDCTFREAHIISSVLSKVSVPALHSAAALLRLCDLAAEQFTTRQYGGGASTSCTNVFIKCLIEKKYALPWKVVDALVFHFCRFKAIDPNALMDNTDLDTAMTDGPTGGGGNSSTQDKLPLLWHQCLLAFAQRYRNDIAEDQREALLDLVQLRGHPAIGPEVRRELLEGRSRDAPVQAVSAEQGMNAGAEKIFHGVGLPSTTAAMVEAGDDTMVMG